MHNIMNACSHARIISYTYFNLELGNSLQDARHATTCSRIMVTCSIYTQHNTIKQVHMTFFKCEGLKPKTPGLHVDSL